MATTNPYRRLGLTEDEAELQARRKREALARREERSAQKGQRRLEQLARPTPPPQARPTPSRAKGQMSRDVLHAPIRRRVFVPTPTAPQPQAKRSTSARIVDACIDNPHWVLASIVAGIIIGRLVILRFMM